MVEKSPITCVLWPSVWCASPGTSPGTCVGFSCSSRRVRAAVDQRPRARGPSIVLHGRLRQRARRSRGDQAGAGGARAAGLAAAFLFLGS